MSPQSACGGYLHEPVSHASLQKYAPLPPLPPPPLKACIFYGRRERNLIILTKRFEEICTREPLWFTIQDDLALYYLFPKLIVFPFLLISMVINSNLALCTQF